jgi:predicted Fe-Mo cluster-binding NifX family protein
MLFWGHRSQWDGGRLTVKTLGTSILIFGLFFGGGFQYLQGQEETPLKIAVASSGKTRDAQVADQAARCPWLLFFDEEGQLLEVLENPYQQAGGGAGLKCIELLTDRKVSVFAAGRVGNKMAGALEQNGITFVAFRGTVEDAVRHILKDPMSPEDESQNQKKYLDRSSTR